MYGYVLQTEIAGRRVCNGGQQAILMTGEIADQFAKWYGADWQGLFDARGAELTALHPACRGRHENPRIAPPEFRPRPSLPRVEQIHTAVIGASVLVAIKLPRDGLTWVKARVVATPDAVQLVDGRILPTSTPAAAVFELERMPSDGKFEVAADGTCWRRDKAGALTRLQRFAGDLRTLGEIAASEAKTAMISVTRGDSQRWVTVELA